MERDPDTPDDVLSPISDRTPTQDETTTELPAVLPATDDTRVLPPVPGAGQDAVGDETDVLPPVPDGAGMPAARQGNENERPIFSDQTGRRHKLAQRAGVGFAALGTGYLIMVVVSLLGGPAAPSVPLPGGDDPESPATSPAEPVSTSPASQGATETTPEPTSAPSLTSTPTSPAPTSQRGTSSAPASTSSKATTSTTTTSSSPSPSGSAAPSAGDAASSGAASP